VYSSSLIGEYTAHTGQNYTAIS